jgi:hypothetical protein
MCLDQIWDRDYQRGLAYCRFIYRWIFDKTGRKIQHYRDQSKGENNYGVEVKLDDKMCRTGNLFIELATLERQDNTKFILQGDYRQFWTFTKEKLIEVKDKDKYRKMKCRTSPSMGFLLPVRDADKICVSHNIIKSET